MLSRTIVLPFLLPCWWRSCAIDEPTGTSFFMISTLCPVLGDRILNALLEYICHMLAFHFKLFYSMNKIVAAETFPYFLILVPYQKIILFKNFLSPFFLPLPFLWHFLLYWASNRTKTWVSLKLGRHFPTVQCPEDLQSQFRLDCF